MSEIFHVGKGEVMWQAPTVTLWGRIFSFLPAWAGFGGTLLIRDDETHLSVLGFDEGVFYYDPYDECK